MDEYVPRRKGRRPSCVCGVCAVCVAAKYMGAYAQRTDKLCSVEGCSRPLYAKGMCNPHWQKKRKEDPKVRERVRQQARDYIAKSADYREHRRKYKNHYRQTNLNYHLADAMRARLYNAVKRNQKSGSAVRDLGCTIPQLRAYLESKFLPGMSWENWGTDGWHIDHVIPLAKFDLSDPEQLKQALHYTNLQPLWSSDNMSKGAS